MAQRAGWEFQIDINGYPFNAKRYNVEASCPSLDTSNSEGKPGRVGAATARGFKAVLKNLKSLRLTVEQASYDDTASPFDHQVDAGVTGVREGNYLKDVKIYPGGRGGVKTHSMDYILVTKAVLSGTVGENQPFSFEGESDGNYNLT